MKISQINYSNYNRNNFAFKSTTSFLKTDLGQEIGSNSWMYREDVDWAEAADFEMQHFKDKDRVKIMQFASSDGSESYTKIISLLKQNEKEAQKFFPIEAYDINHDVVNAAKSGLINFVAKDFERAEKFKVDLKEFFTEATTTLSIKNDNMYHFFNIPTTTYRASDNLRNKVNFHSKDMFEVLQEVKDGELPIVLCRNMFSYLDEIDAQRAVNLIGRKMLNGGLFYLGKRDFDTHNISQWLKDAGFIPAKYNKNGILKTLDFVFMKAPKL